MDTALTRKTALRPSLFSMGSFFDDLLFNDLMGRTCAVTSMVRPTASGQRISIAAPGLKKEDFKVTLEGELLRVSVSSNDSNTFCQSFSKSWTLPPGVLEEQITASYVDGVLALDIPMAVRTAKKLSIAVK